jgi:hypothetical protein
MPKAIPYHELQKLTREQLVAMYDEMALSSPGIHIGLDFVKHEIWRRDQEAQTRTMLRLTWVITVLTAANVVAVLVALAG